MEEQAGFRKDRRMVQEIPTLRLRAEKTRRKSKLVLNCFIAPEKVFDAMKHEVFWFVLNSFGVDMNVIPY